MSDKAVACTIVADIVEAGGAVLSEDEKRCIVQILRNDGAPDEVLPDNIAPGSLWDYFSACMKTMKSLEEYSEVIQRYVGRLLVLMQKNPSIYKSRGYRTLDDFITRGAEVAFGISRATAYRMKSIAERLPGISEADYKAVGATKLGVIARIVPENDKRFPALLEEAKKPEVTADRLKAMAYEQNLAGEGELETRTLVLTVPRSVFDRYIEWKKDPIIQTVVGREGDGALLDAMMDEVETEWRGRVEELMRQGR